jgi:hypothetical protein
MTPCSPAFYSAYQVQDVHYEPLLFAECVVPLAAALSAMLHGWNISYQSKFHNLGLHVSCSAVAFSAAKHTIVYGCSRKHGNNSKSTHNNSHNNTA